MKKLISFIGAFAIVGALATSVHATPSTVSIGGAQFGFTGLTTDDFSTSSLSNKVSAEFFDTAGGSVLFTDAKLVVTPVDFSGGLSAGTGGGFKIINNAGGATLLTGSFGIGSTLKDEGNGIIFEANVVSTFTNFGLVGTLYFPPGTFSANGVRISGPFSGTWNTNGSAVASIGSSNVPEPASLMLLGAGLAGIGIWRRKSTKS